MQSIAKFTYTAVGHCEVAGVPYAPGELIHTDDQSTVAYLVEQGAAVASGGVVEAPAAEPKTVARTTRSK